MSLNPGQQAAVDAPGHCLIVACPGSGKTHTLVQRAEKILAASTTSRVAFVTFTRASADELKERVIRKMGDQVLSRIESGTFHSLCLQQLQAAIPNQPLPFKIATEGFCHTLMMKAWEVAFKKFPKARLTRNSVVEAIQYAKANDGFVPQSQQSDALTFALDSYNEALKSNSQIDFADIIKMTVNGMANRQIPHLKVTDVLVDEFQDVDEVQLQWILKHLQFGARLTCVGDDDQSIYGFRFSKGYQGMMQFARESNAQVIQLDTTYRCSGTVMNHAVRLIAVNKDRVKKTIKTANRSTGLVERLDFDKFDDEVDAVCEDLGNLPASTSSAILTRLRSTLRIIETTMMYKELPYQGGTDGGIWSGGVPGIVHGLMGAVLGKNPTGVSMALSALGMSSKVVMEARKLLTESGSRIDVILKSSGWMGTATPEEHELWDEARTGYSSVLNAVKSSPAEFASACTSFLRPGVAKFTSEKIFDLVPAIISRMPGGLTEVHQRIDRSLRSKDKAKEDGQGVFLLTLHSSKGLEFDRVWMPALRQGLLPHGKGEITEERRLCYVGMTRARQHLTMSYSWAQDAPESIFFKEAGLVASNAVRMA